MSGDSCASGRLPSLVAPSESSHSSSLHCTTPYLPRKARTNENDAVPANSRQLPKIGSKGVVSNSKYDQMTRFMTEVAEDQFKDTGSGKSLGITKIEIIPTAGSGRLSTMGSVGGQGMNEEREERRRMNDVRDRMDTAQRKRDRAGPGSSLGAIGDRFTLLPPSCRQGEGTDDSQEAQIRCDEEDEEISIPHLVLQIERGANGHSRTVARDDRVAGQPHEVGRAEMNLPSFVRQKSRSTSTRSLTPPPSWLAPHLSLPAQKLSRSLDRPSKRRRTSIAHSVSSYEVPVGVSYSSSPRNHQEERYHPHQDYSESMDGRPFAENGTMGYDPMTVEAYDSPPTVSIYARQLDRIHHHHPSSFHSTPTLHDQDIYVDRSLPPSLPLPLPAQNYELPIPSPRFQNRQLPQSSSHPPSLRPLPHPLRPSNIEIVQQSAVERGERWELQERLKGVVDDLTNFWKRARADQGITPSSTFERTDHFSNQDDAEQIDHYAPRTISPSQSEMIYGQRIPLDPQMIPILSAQESIPPPFLPQDPQHSVSANLPDYIRFISQIPPTANSTIKNDSYGLPMDQPPFPRLSTPLENVRMINQSNYLLETPLHSIPPTGIFAQFDGGMIRSDDLDEFGDRYENEKDKEGEGEGEGDEPIESEYELTYSQVPSEDSPQGMDKEVENRPVLPPSSPPTTLTSLDVDGDLDSSTEDNHFPTALSGEQEQEGGGEGDIEPGWRRRRNVVVDSTIREDEEEFLLLSEDLSIEEMEIMAG